MIQYTVFTDIEPATFWDNFWHYMKELDGAWADCSEEVPWASISELGWGAFDVPDDDIPRATHVLAKVIGSDWIGEDPDTWEGKTYCTPVGELYLGDILMLAWAYAAMIRVSDPMGSVNGMPLRFMGEVDQDFTAEMHAIGDVLFSIGDFVPFDNY